MSDQLSYCPFVVDETPYALWDANINELNIRFLNSIDPKYFEHFAVVHGGLLESEDCQYAAVALRSAYAHGLETLFALIGAGVQAPDCAIGWMLKYKSSELFKLTRKIDNRQPILNVFKTGALSWEHVAEIFLANLSVGDDEKDQEIRDNFARLWKRLAKDFLDEDYSKEYNSVKHGLRVGMGGFTLAIGAEDIPGIPCPPERMKSLGGSHFGTEFYVSEDLVDKVNFRAKRKSLNWSPKNLLCGLQLIALSIENLISALKVLNGVKADQVKFHWLPKSEDYDSPWQIRFTMQKFEMNPVLLSDWISPISKEEVKAHYRLDQLSEKVDDIR